MTTIDFLEAFQTTSANHPLQVLEYELLLAR